NPMDAAEAADLFRQFMGGGGPVDMDEVFTPRARGGRKRRSASPRDVESEVAIPFLTAANGGTVALQMDGRELDVKIPSGVEDGQVLRVHGQAPGGGDLLLKLRVQPHSHFRREGKNV